MSRRRRNKRRDDDESLAAGDGQQMQLLDVPEHPLEAVARATKRCTGELLYERDRRAYDELLTALAAGKSVRWCMRMYGIGTHTVLAIARREKLEVATRKAALADAMLLGAEVYAERALELAGDCDDAYSAAATAKMLAETGNLMRGQATAIVGGVVVHVDANAMAAQLAAKAQQMDSGAGKMAALGALGEKPGPADKGEKPGPADKQAAVDAALTVDFEVITIPCHASRHTLAGSNGVVLTGGGGGSPENSCPSSISIGGGEIL